MINNMAAIVGHGSCGFDRAFMGGVCLGFHWVLCSLKKWMNPRSTTPQVNQVLYKLKLTLTKQNKKNVIFHEVIEYYCVKFPIQPWFSKVCPAVKTEISGEKKIACINQVGGIYCKLPLHLTCHLFKLNLCKNNKIYCVRLSREKLQWPFERRTVSHINDILASLVDQAHTPFHWIERSGVCFILYAYHDSCSNGLSVVWFYYVRKHLWIASKH